MSNYQEKPGTGALFENKNKKSENHPDVKGTYTTKQGIQLKLAGWKRTTKTGEIMISIKEEEPFEKK